MVLRSAICDLQFATCDFCLRLVGRSVGPECRGKLTQRSSLAMFRVLTNAPPSWVPDVSVMPIGNAPDIKRVTRRWRARLMVRNSVAEIGQ